MPWKAHHVLTETGKRMSVCISDFLSVLASLQKWKAFSFHLHLECSMQFKLSPVMLNLQGLKKMNDVYI